MEQVLIYAKNKALFKPYKQQEEYTIDKFEWKIHEIKKGRIIKLGGKNVEIFKLGDYKIEKIKPNKKGLKETWATGSLLRQKGSSGEFLFTYISPRKDEDGLGCLYKVYGMGEDGLGYRYFTGPKRSTATKGKFYSGIPLQRIKELNEGTAKKEIPIGNFYDFSNSFDFAAEFGNCRQEGDVDISGGKKPEILMQTILQYFTKENDIVLDSFIGSGTTCAVAHKMGRQYIGIEQLYYGNNDSVSRLANVIKGDNTGISESVNWQGGGEFIYCELMKYNEIFMERLQAANSTEELVQIWGEMAEGSFLNWYVNPKMPEEAVKDFKELGKGEGGTEKQKQLLAELLDKNQLYVNLTEIDDVQFKVSEEDKALNRAFYGE